MANKLQQFSERERKKNKATTENALRSSLHNSGVGNIIYIYIPSLQTRTLPCHISTERVGKYFRPLKACKTKFRSASLNHFFVMQKNLFFFLILRVAIDAARQQTRNIYNEKERQLNNESSHSQSDEASRKSKGSATNSHTETINDGKKKKSINKKRGGQKGIFTNDSNARPRKRNARAD